MDMNDYALEIIARERLAEIRAASKRLNCLQAGGQGLSPFRAALGHALLWTSRALLRMAMRFLRLSDPLPHGAARS